MIEFFHILQLSIGGRRFTMENSLANKHPELVSEWSEKNLPITADMVIYGSNKQMWWKGICGHE